MGEEEEHRRRTFTMPSYKADNRPCAVEHLVQTLGEKIRDKWNKVGYKNR